MEKELTIDEILVKNGILYANGKLHDSMIVSMNEFSCQNTKPLTISLQEANNQNYNLLQEKLKLENEIIDLKKTIETYSNYRKDISDIIKTCEKKRNYEKCEIWDSALKVCASCKFYLSKNKEK